jgi:glutathione S-transferase
MMLNIIDMIYQGPKGDDVRGLRGFVVGFAESRLDALVAELEGKEYLCGPFSAADVLLTTVLRILRDTDLVEERPLLKAYQERCEQRPAFRKALADHLASFDEEPPRVS